MKCLKCGKNIDDGVEKCPFCGRILSTSEEIEMPELKKEEIIELSDDDVNLSDNDFGVELPLEEEDETFDQFEGIDQNPAGEDDDEDTPLLSEEEVMSDEDLELEKTRSISSLEKTKELTDLSLIDAINQQIDTINEESMQQEESTSSLEEQGEELPEANLSTIDSIKKRKKILCITGVCSLVLALIFLCIFCFTGKEKEAKEVKDYMSAYDAALQKYYDTREIDDVIYILESIKKDNDKVKNVQMKTRTTFDSWILLYIEEEASTIAEYDEITEKYKELLNGLHQYAIVKEDDKYILALTDYDYEELLKQIEDLYSDSTTFFDALVFYNEKDYDKAYYMFDRIEKENSYYEKAQSYKSKVIDNVIALMNTDIQKLNTGIDDLDDASKLQIYVHIEEIILSYNNVYSNLSLSDNSKYQSLLSLYTSKVSEYTEKVSHSGNDSPSNNSGSSGENREPSNPSQENPTPTDELENGEEEETNE